MPENNKIHIVSFNVPYPADYGGVMDVFYKIKSLHSEGAEIYLHCYAYGRKETDELNKYCKKVYYYQRKKGIRYLINKLPYIIATRNSKDLLETILQIKAPILFEGLHTCYLISNRKLTEYSKIVRMHNIEHDYYSGLAKVESNLLRKIYFKREAKKLKSFEALINKANCVVTISKADQQYFSKIHNNSVFISGFHKFENIRSETGKGNYILFHGNLGVAENKKAIEFILSEVKIQEHFPLIITGKNPTRDLLMQEQKFKNLQVVANPSEEKMNELLLNAHVCFIPTFQPTGLKLKLLGSLFASRFVVANSMMVKNTGLEQLCYVFDNPKELKNCIFDLFSKSFSDEEITRRKLILERNFSNKINANKLFAIITNNR